MSPFADEGGRRSRADVADAARDAATRVLEHGGRACWTTCRWWEPSTASTKKVLTGFGAGEGENAFQRFVLAQLPSRTTPGFLTGTFTLERLDGSRHELCTVYVPTTTSTSETWWCCRSIT